jgi:hypothetical protein
MIVCIPAHVDSSFWIALRSSGSVVCNAAGGDRSLCFSIFTLQADVGHDPAIFLSGVSLRVNASDENGPLDLVLTLDEYHPSREQRTLSFRENTLPSEIYNMFEVDFMWSLSSQV